MTKVLTNEVFEDISDITCRLDGARVIVEAWGRRVVVDCRDHDLMLEGADRPVRLAASRIGLAETVQRVAAAFHDALPRETIEAALVEALLVAARGARAGIDDAFTAVDGLWPTPLVLSRGVVQNQYLVGDVARFRPAAVAMTRIEEDDVTDASVPERAELWAARLSRWRELYCAEGSVQRSVNRTLSRFGDEASAEALWGLRAVPMEAPLPSVQHLEVLGCLGARQPRGAVVPLVLREAVLRASSEELGTALVMIDEGLDRVSFGRDAPAMRLAEILSIFSLDRLRADLARRIRFEDLLNHAIHALREVLKLDAETIPPPIALPTAPGVTFLGNVADILREGVEMDHCVATRAPRALAGRSYIFRVRAGGYRATVEVDKAGAILEARGPGNQPTPAVAWAEHVLGCWAAPLRFAALGDPATPVWHEPAPPLRAGLEPVRTLGELQEALTALTTPVQDKDEHVIAWALAAAARAMATARGDDDIDPLWLTVQRVAGLPFEIWSIDEHGTALTSTMIVRESAPSPPPIDLDAPEDEHYDADLRTPPDGTPLFDDHDE